MAARRTQMVLSSILLSTFMSMAHAQNIQPAKPLIARTEDVQKPMTNSELLSRVAIEALSIEYFFLLDHGQSAKLADLYTENGSMNGTVGREAIRKYYAARPSSRTTRHVSTNLRLVFQDEDHARGVRTFTYYAAEEGQPRIAVPAIGEYRESFVRGKDGQWRFETRDVEPIFDKRP